MKLSKQIEIQFLDGTFNVDISVERQTSNDGTDVRWFIDAITETGYNLSGPSYGLIRYVADANKRLKALSSIEQEGNDLLDSLVAAIKISAIKTINKRLIVSHKLSSNEYQFIKGIQFPTHCIKSKQSGLCISWHKHDVYSDNVTLDIEFIRLESDQLQASADENLLYNKDKLLDLADSIQFKEQKFSFFFYNEVERLLDRPINGSPKSMSGLFSRVCKK